MPVTVLPNMKTQAAAATNLTSQKKNKRATIKVNTY